MPRRFSYPNHLLFFSTISMNFLKLSAPTRVLTFSQAGPIAAFHGPRSGRATTMPFVVSRSFN